MQIASVPAKIDIIFAENTTTSYVRAIPDTTTDPNAASLSLGFPPNTFVDPGAGGEPPDGRDMNGILQRITAWTQWLNAGAPVFYDSGFSGAIGGYPKYAMLANATTPGQFWISTADNNTSDPDASGANWSAFPPALGAYVSSFNGRTGAVTLTSSDVVSALATNALPNLKLALMAALTVKANITGSPATPSDVPIADLALAVFGGGNFASTGHIAIPVVIAGVLQNFILNWGFTSTGGGSAHASFDMPFPNAVFFALATGNVTAPATVESLTTAGMTVNSGSPNNGAWWISGGW